MAIIKLNPFFNQGFMRPFWSDNLDEWPEYTMTEGLDVYEEDGNIVVKAAVPGVKEDNVNITYEDGVLHIIAKEESNEQEKKKNRIVHRMQRVASFEYTTTLPRPIDAGRIEAQIDYGVVKIIAPIAEAAKAKKIPVKTVSKK